LGCRDLKSQATSPIPSTIRAANAASHEEVCMLNNAVREAVGGV
jgi:hypothetical protein